MGRTLLGLFIGSMLLFVVVLPGNHSEAEDAFEYSRLIEEGRGAELFHPHHLLYLPAQKSIFNAVRAMGYDGRSYDVARAVSMLAGAASLGLFFLIAGRLQSLTSGRTDRRLPWVATLGLLSTYGFVRYACEVEIYVPAMALMLAAVYSALRASNSIRWFLAGILLSALALLTHTINAATALVVVPFIYALSHRRWKQSLLHIVATLIIIGLAYGVVQNTCGTFRPATDTAAEGWLQPGTIGKAVVGFGQCILSANFVFAYEGVTEKLQALFPYRVFAEEIFAASHFPPWLKVLAPATFLSTLLAWVGGALFLLVSAARRRIFDRTLMWILLWLGGTLFPTLMLEPSNPELWVLVLAPLWAVFLWLAVSLDLSVRMVRVVWAMVALLGVHNLVAGMGAVRNRAGDYNFAKAEWVLRQAGPDDTIHTADSFVFSFYLDYWSEAEIRNVNTQDWRSGATTYVFGDVFNPPPAVGVRYPLFAEKVSATAAALGPHCRKIHNDPFGGIWIVDSKNPR